MNTQSIHTSELQLDSESMGRGGGEIRAILQALWRGRVIIAGVFVVLSAIAAAVVWLIPGKYQSEVIVLVQPVGNLADPNALNAQASPEIVRSQLEVVQSQTVMERVVDRLGLMGDPDYAPKGSMRDAPADTRKAAVIANVAKNLKADNDGRSATIHITFDARSPAKAAHIADTIADEYIHTQGELKSRAIQATKARLDGRLADLRDQAIGAEQLAEDYRRSVGLIMLAPAPDGNDGSAANSYTARLLDEFSRQAAGLTASAAQANARAHDAATDMSRSGGANTPEALSSSVISSLLQQDSELAKQEAQLAARYTAEHPQLVQVRAQRAELQRALSAARGNVETSLRIAANSANAAESAASAKASALSGRVNKEIAEGVRYRQLLQDARIKRKTYEDFADQSGVISERALLQLPDAMLVSPASLPIKESWPKRWLIFGLCCFAAFVAGCAAAIARELGRRDRI